MAKKLISKQANFGTLPVFITSISTILGAVLFLRFGWAVGNLGFYGTLGIIALGHLITIPTAFAVAEIATNQKVQGGGAYYIISRSFGLNIGGAIGITLFLSQAISVAFYIIAFTEAFEPLFKYIASEYGFYILDKRVISVPITILLSLLILSKGANLGMKALYGVTFILFVSILMFLFGKSDIDASEVAKNFHTYSGLRTGFFEVFAVIFPAFTGLAAGLGLSGDLKDPKISIPRGTIWATIIGMIIYIIVAYKLWISAYTKDLIEDQLIMQRIALWGPIIPIGLAAASLSSALGSIMIAPRTLQALGLDDIFPNTKLNTWLSKIKPKNSEPFNASIITVAIAFFFVAIAPGKIYYDGPAPAGETGINFIANIISMFFILTYGAICSISFLEHFAADPSYRPTFKSKWYLSFIGMILSFWAMFQMNFTYAAASLAIMTLIYWRISIAHEDRKGFGKLIRGVIFQLSRALQIIAQRADKEDRESSWRPFIICISADSFQRRSAFDLLRWISYKYGFGTYIHYIQGKLTKKTLKESEHVLERLIHLAKGSKNKIYLDTIISPSYTSAIAQVVQLSGISGKGNNMILFEYSRTDHSTFKHVINDYALIESTGFDICILNTSYKGFGYHKEIHIYIEPEDYDNANLMILLAYIILGHPEWSDGFIKIIALYDEKNLDKEKENLLQLIKSGRLPISPSNVEILSYDENKMGQELISEHSADADLTIMGFQNHHIHEPNSKLFIDYKDIGNILFVNSNKIKEIK
ncbi:MAG: Na-K-Cl cotransporter [Marinilabiliales bacterium]